MPCCAAYGCSVRPGQGKLLHRFPRDKTRRKLWEIKVRRKDWKATDFSVLCEGHFDENQYERGRADGLRRLKPNAVPTKFIFTPPECPNRPTKRSRTEDGPCPGAQEHIYVARSYCSTESQTDLPRVHVCKEEVQTDEEHCNQERNFSLDQEESEIKSEIKEEQEELCIGQEGELLVVVLKEEPDTLMVTPTYAESDHNVAERNGDQVLSQTDRKDQEEKKPVELGSVSDSDLNPSKNCLKNTSHSHTGGNCPMSESLCDSGANKEVFKCDVCGKVFNSKLRMRNHDKIHTRQKRYLCSTCGKRFKDASTLKYHVRTHTGEKPYSCENCTKCFSCYGKLLVHMRIHTGDKPYLCNTCGRGFSQSSALKRHTAIHTDEKLYSCKICGKSFAQNSDVTVHVRTHTGEKPYVCNTCGRRFSDASAFKRHKAIHINEKTYSCKICGKSFRQSGHLLRHMTIHTGDKPFLCKNCGKTFRQSNNLMRHLKIHSDDSSYACNTCGKQFIRPSWLKRHIDSHR